MTPALFFADAFYSDLNNGIPEVHEANKEASGTAMAKQHAKYLGTTVEGTYHFCVLIQPACYSNTLGHLCALRKFEDLRFSPYYLPAQAVVFFVANKHDQRNNDSFLE